MVRAAILLDFSRRLATHRYKPFAVYRLGEQLGRPLVGARARNLKSTTILPSAEVRIEISFSQTPAESQSETISMQNFNVSPEKIPANRLTNFSLTNCNQLRIGSCKSFLRLVVVEKRTSWVESINRRNFPRRDELSNHPRRVRPELTKEQSAEILDSGPKPTNPRECPTMCRFSNLMNPFRWRKSMKLAVSFAVSSTRLRAAI